MILGKKYKFNIETLNYELYTVSFSKRLFRYFIFLVISLGLFLFYFYIYTNVFGQKTPKQQLVEKNVTQWRTKLEILEKRYDNVGNSLADLQARDNSIYRPIFGMEAIPSSVRNAGFGGTDRYEYLKEMDYSGLLTSTIKKYDILYKRAFIQSKSLDEISILSNQAGLMAMCIPSISPVEPRVGKHRISSSFGYRKHPLTGVYKMHAGMDIAGPKGEEPNIRTTGNGKVVKVVRNIFGLGNYVVVDHGFGYKTRYAHMKSISVKVGQSVCRGEVLGVMGNTGVSTGTHLHYEVEYLGKKVNPINYLNFNIDYDEYYAILKISANQNRGNEII